MASKSDVFSTVLRSTGLLFECLDKPRHQILSKEDLVLAFKALLQREDLRILYAQQFPFGVLARLPILGLPPVDHALIFKAARQGPDELELNELLSIWFNPGWIMVLLFELRRLRGPAWNEN